MESVKSIHIRAMASVKIVSFELENVKRVQVVRVELCASGLLTIGGDNCQGKTSIIDAIIFALGGEKYRPSNLQRDGALASARIELRLSNGILVVREGKNAALKVTDPSGQKAGQKLLDSFIDELALNLPRFLAMTGKQKADVLLRILGIGDQLAVLEKEERAAYDERTTQGRIADQKEKFAREMPEHHDAPEQLLSAEDLVAASQSVMQRNAERAATRANIGKIEAAVTAARIAEDAAQQAVKRLNEELQRAVTESTRRRVDREAAELQLRAAQVAPPTADESTAEISAKLGELELVNAKVRANLDKHKAVEDAKAASEEVAKLTARVDEVRNRRKALLDGAAMPLPGLSVEGGELTYNGKAWDCMSGVEQIRAGVAIVRKLKPECGFVLLDKLEAFDLTQLQELHEWLISEGLQGIGTRVSRGEECSLIIEDGLVVGGQPAAVSVQPSPVVGETEAEW